MRLRQSLAIVLPLVQDFYRLKVLDRARIWDRLNDRARRVNTWWHLCDRGRGMGGLILAQFLSMDSAQLIRVYICFLLVFARVWEGRLQVTWPTLWRRDAGAWCVIIGVVSCCMVLIVAPSPTCEHALVLLLSSKRLFTAVQLIWAWFVISTFQVYIVLQLTARDIGSFIRGESLVKSCIRLLSMIADWVLDKVVADFVSTIRSPSHQGSVRLILKADCRCFGCHGGHYIFVMPQFGLRRKKLLLLLSLGWQIRYFGWYEFLSITHARFWWRADLKLTHWCLLAAICQRIREAVIHEFVQLLLVTRFKDILIFFGMDCFQCLREHAVNDILPWEINRSLCFVDPIIYSFCGNFCLFMVRICVQVGLNRDRDWIDVTFLGAIFDPLPLAIIFLANTAVSSCCLCN